MAITEISKDITMNYGKHFPEITPMDSTRMLVLSLGTGAPKLAEKYSAARASNWGSRGWIFDNGNTPILDVYFDASSDMVDIHVSTLFQSFDSKDNYLRIQVPINNHMYNYLFLFFMRP